MQLLEANGAIFPAEYDEWEEGIPENMVLLSDPIRESLFNRLEYLKYLLLTSKEMLRLHKKYKDDQYAEEVKELEGLIKALKKYIKNPDFPL